MTKEQYNRAIELSKIIKEEEYILDNLRMVILTLKNEGASYRSEVKVRKYEFTVQQSIMLEITEKEEEKTKEKIKNAEAELEAL